MWKRTQDVLPTPEAIFREQGTPAWGTRFWGFLRDLTQSLDRNGLDLDNAPPKIRVGTTTERPTGGNLRVGEQFFDISLGIPIWHDGADWIDATGSTV